MAAPVFHFPVLYAPQRLLFPSCALLAFRDVWGTTHHVTLFPMSQQEATGEKSQVLRGRSRSGLVVNVMTLHDSMLQESLANVLRAHPGYNLEASSGAIVVAEILYTLQGATEQDTVALGENPPILDKQQEASNGLADLRLTHWQWCLLQTQLPELYDIVADATEKDV